MSNIVKELAEDLQIDLDEAKQVPQIIRKHAFFARLAEYGIVPQTEQEAVNLMQASDVLEEKTASMAAKANPVNRALGIILKDKQTCSNSKVASNPNSHDVSLEQNRKEACAEYMQNYLTDPALYGALMTNVL